MILEICHSWGRDPAWFGGLPRGEQVRLIGWWRSRVPREATRPTRQGPRPSRAAEALARQVADHRRELRERVTVDGRQAEDFWFGGE